MKNKQDLKYYMRHFGRGKEFEKEFDESHFKGDAAVRFEEGRLTRQDCLEAVNEWNRVGRIADGPWIYWLGP